MYKGIGEIIGRCHSPYNIGFVQQYDISTIYVSSFVCADKNVDMVQVSVSDVDSISYVQLDKQQIVELMEMLMESINK